MVYYFPSFTANGFILLSTGFHLDILDILFMMWVSEIYAQL
jgi:hypothetical protein